MTCMMANSIPIQNKEAALLLAVQGGHTITVNVLVKAGVDVDKGNWVSRLVK